MQWPKYVANLKLNIHLGSLCLVCFSPSRLFALQGTGFLPGSIFFLSVRLHLAIMATFLSQSRGLFSPLLTDVIIGLLLNVNHYMPFLLPDAPHRTDYSQSDGDQKKIALL